MASFLTWLAGALAVIGTFELILQDFGFAISAALLGLLWLLIGRIVHQSEQPPRQ